MRRTKIVCTIGPASESIDVLTELINNGMNVARLNFSHGTHQEHAQRIKNIRLAADSLGANIAILLDTRGPEIRTGQLQADKIMLSQGELITLTTEQIIGDAQKISVTYADFSTDVQVGNAILIADGNIELKVTSIKDKEVFCQVVNGGELGSQKNLHVPGITINLPAVSEKDCADIKFAIENGLDFIAASFVRKATDIIDIRRILEEQGSQISLIAKIESHEGVKNIDEILKVANGIMVARGDLGVDIPTEEVPLVQKMIIEKCNRAGRPVITATQMLESMIQNPRPTRAEATDIANSIFDGTDAIMLSGETAAGKYPVEAVKMMAKIATRTEKALHYKEILGKKDILPAKTVTDAISHAVCTTALDLGARAIITSTSSGHTARMVSKYRPEARVIAVTTKIEVVRKLAIVWGVKPLLVKETRGTDEMIEEAIKVSLDAKYIKNGDLVVVTAGIPVGVAGTTNLLKVHTVGDIWARGQGIGNQATNGTVRIVKSPKEAMENIKLGDILVTAGTDKEFMPAMEKAAAIITEAGGLTSHAAIVALHLGIPAIVGVDGATSILQDGMTVTIDGARGLIYKGVTKVL